jgi:putative protease
VTKKIELLAPVGNMESLYAAVRNGADAVYLGGKLFNARIYASNFDLEKLKEAVLYAHLHGVSVYVTANILVDDAEMNDVIDYIKYLYDINVDAVIIQDIGLSNIVRKIFSELHIHGSTQMTINNLQGVKFLEGLGFTRVVLARETPIEEIEQINKNSSIELENFIHGALCMSYSGQCLMSSLIGGRSGNRGACAGPCRMAYSVVDEEGKLLKGWDKKYVLSPMDLNSLENIEKIIDAGITSLKIEGRMKRPEYVATVVSAYRKAIDYSCSSLSELDKRNVEQIFNRGFTKGLAFGDFGSTFVSKDRPDNRGVYIGKVIKVEKNYVSILLDGEINENDGLEFQLANGEYKGFKSPVNGKNGETVRFNKIGNVLKDSKVYKTSSEKLLREARLSYESLEKFPIDIEIVVKIGERPKIKLRYKDIIVEATGETYVEKGIKIALTKEKIHEQISKLGDTFYYANKCSVSLDDNAYLPLSVLNQLRRDVIDKLNEKIRNSSHRKPINDEVFNQLKFEVFKSKRGNKKSYKKLSISVESLEQFNQLDLNKLDRIYLGFYDNLYEVVNKIKSKDKEVYISTGRVLYQKDLDELRNYISPISQLVDGISVSNLGSLKYFSDSFDLKIHCDTGLNLFNSFSIKFLNNLGISSFTLSPELNLQQIKKITEKVEGNIEGIVYGYLPVMITGNCPMAIVKGCKDDRNCKACKFSKGYGLKDRKDFIFETQRKNGYSVIYNSVPIFVLDSIDKIFAAGINMARLDFTNEIKDISKIQSVLYDYINNLKGYNDLLNFIEEFKSQNNITNGHYFRGVLEVIK